MLTHGTLEGLSRDDDARAVLAAMMVESRLVGEKLGIKFPVSVEERMGMAEKVGPHKTSMLQDLKPAGRWKSVA